MKKRVFSSYFYQRLKIYFPRIVVIQTDKPEICGTCILLYGVLSSLKTIYCVNSL